MFGNEWKLVPEALQMSEGDTSLALVEREEWQSGPGLLSGLVSHLCSHQAAGFANVLP